jgi:hypothetical protein
MEAFHADLAQAAANASSTGNLQMPPGAEEYADSPFNFNNGSGGNEYDYGPAS